MAGSMDYLFQGTAPPAITTAVGATNGLPDWYQEMVRGVGAKGIDIAGQTQEQGAPQLGVAGFTGDQLGAFQGVRENVGSWKPNWDAANTALDGVVPTAQNYAGEAMDAVGGAPATWDQSWQKYMSPYTQGVVDNIGRLGKRNFEENIMPGVNNSMIGTGQFGSTRNADILSRAGRDASADITGMQSNALQAGYDSGANIFAGDASRAQAGQQLRAGTALSAGQNVAGAMSNVAGQRGALGQMYSSMGLGDAQAMGAVGAQQQQMNQAGLDTGYSNAMNNLNFDWNNLNNLNSVIRGMQLPTTGVATQTGPAANYRPGALQTLGTGYSMMRGTGAQ